MSVNDLIEGNVHTTYTPYAEMKALGIVCDGCGKKDYGCISYFPNPRAPLEDRVDVCVKCVVSHTPRPVGHLDGSRDTAWGKARGLGALGGNRSRY